MRQTNFPNRKLADVALGREPADLVIREGVLLDVYSGRMIPGRSVAVSGQWIAYVGADASHTIGRNTEVIEADGRIISPGYMDTHTHLAGCWDISDFLKYAIPGGTTTFITEAEAYACALGVEGFKAFLDQIGNRPVKMFGLIPAMVTLSPATESLAISRHDVQELLKDDRVLGIGESYWQNVVLNSNGRVMEMMREALKAGKSVQGHGAGAFDRKLAAYTAAGALSCHEAITSEDVLSRLEYGYYVMVREGDVRRDLEIIIPIKDDIDLRRVILVTDGVNPDLLIKEGYLVDVVQKAVDLGVDPIHAVQMVSINPAEHFGIDHFTGGVSPGRMADILILPEEGVMSPDMVLSNGVVVAINGETKVPLPKVPHPESLYHTLKIDPISEADLHIPLPEEGPEEYVRTIDIQPGGLVTREGKAEAQPLDGQYCAAPDRDLLKVVFLERATGKGERFVGFVRGWGQKRGAVAISQCWDCSGVLAIGAEDRDLVLAVNRLIEIQGGIVLTVEGRVEMEIPFAIGGYVSEMPIEEIARNMRRFQEAMAGLGSTLENAFLTMCTLASPAIPFIRIIEKGYRRFREDDIVGV